MAQTYDGGPSNGRQAYEGLRALVDLYVGRLPDDVARHVNRLTFTWHHRELMNRALVLEDLGWRESPIELPIRLDLSDSDEDPWGYNTDMYDPYFRGSYVLSPEGRIGNLATGGQAQVWRGDEHSLEFIRRYPADYAPLLQNVGATVELEMPAVVDL